MTRNRRVLIAIMLALIVAGVYVTVQFRADMQAARAALAAYDTVSVQTSFGPIELIDVGEGFPVLAIHGTGGGFDQGFALADGLREAGYRVIAPSRFGYPGASIPEHTDARAQADAFAEVLERLGVERAVVLGASAGAITALAFAEQYPDKTAALLPMVPAYFATQQGAPDPWSPMLTWLVTTALRSDFLFWAATELAPVGMASTVFATDRELIEAASPRERARMDALMAMIFPISARADGLMLDARNTAAPPAIDLSRIRAPTFIASAEDDRFETAAPARMLAEGIDGAELLITPDGGHVWVNRADEVEMAVAEFLESVLTRSSRTVE